MRDARVDRGQATVEFALVLPVLLACLLLIVQVGRLVAIQSQVEAAAREGARVAAVGARDEVAGAVRRVSPDAAATVRNEGDWITVTVTREVELVWGFSSTSVTVEADAVMRDETMLGTR